MKRVKLSGAAELAAYVPELQRGRGWLIALAALVPFATATVVMLLLDQVWPAATGAGQVAFILLGFAWAGQFYWRRHAFRSRWGDLAYRNAFGRHILVGLPLIFAALVHTAFLPGERLGHGGVASVTALAGGYLLVTGLALMRRAVSACGLDTLFLLYVYAPPTGRLVDSAVYSLVRHPIYSAVVRVILAVGLWRGTWFSILFGLSMPLGMTLWLRLAEEPELIERFGAGYRDYRRRVPAFWPRRRELGRFYRFLATGR